jgi:ABC-type multidrug transport system ATPase subunit
MIIEASSVCFGYGDGKVLENADLLVGPGLTLLVGPNGCGKSTLMKILAGVERPDEGNVKICGYDLWRDEVEARRRIAYVPEHPDLTPYASLVEVMRLVCRLRSEPVERAMEVLRRAGLADKARSSVRELSAGQRRGALVAAAWIGTPKVALLDEPLELLDRRLRDDCLQWIAGLLKEGAAVVVVSHQVEPFLGMALSAATVCEGRTKGPTALPLEPDVRLELVERLARGDSIRRTRGAS